MPSLYTLQALIEEFNAYLGVSVKAQLLHLKKKSAKDVILLSLYIIFSP